MRTTRTTPSRRWPVRDRRVALVIVLAGLAPMAHASSARAQPAPPTAPATAPATPIPRGASGAAPVSFEEVVKRYSDFAQERIGGGETGWLVEGSPSKKYPSEIVKALLAIPQVGGLAEPVVTDRAVYVVRLGEKRAGGTPSFEAVRPQVERDWLTARRQEVHDAFVARVRQSVPVKLDEAVVQQVIRENQSNARPPAAPFRGGR